MIRQITTVSLAFALCAAADAQTSRRRGSARRANATTATKGQPSSSAAPQSPAKTSAKTPATPAKAAAASDAPPADAPAVTEVDLEGLKKLLQRGDDPEKARPLLVNFWATWCDPCRAEFPDLVKVNNDYKDRGLEFVVVSGDDISEIKSGVPKFLADMKATMPAYLLNVPDMEAAINAVDTEWTGQLPATYLYDRAGRIAFKHFGRVDPKELRAALDKVLAN